jgi:hypothetical protein
LWTFLDVEGIEPTNNASEGALRATVIWRKHLFGSQSTRGSRFVETVPTVIETCPRPARHSLDDLTAALQATSPVNRGLRSSPGCERLPLTAAGKNPFEEPLVLTGLRPWLAGQQSRY